jgi:hypothetical protein
MFLFIIQPAGKLLPALPKDFMLCGVDACYTSLHIPLREVQELWTRIRRGGDEYYFLKGVLDKALVLWTLKKLLTGSSVQYV